MSHVVVTGAGSFIGQRLVTRLLRDGHFAGGPNITRLTVTDINLPAMWSDARLHVVPGSLGDPGVRDALCAGDVDVVLHLAAVPGGAAEANSMLGLDVNVLAPIAFFETLGRQTTPACPPAKIVFTSTIAVFGVPLPDKVDDDTLPLPTMSYGTQKLMMEALLADMTRRGKLDARCVRLPGIVARPRVGGGLVSAFMSNIFHDIPLGKPIILPVSAEGTMWAMSVRRVVDNLLHAASLAPDKLSARRAWTMPAHRTTVGKLVGAIAAQSGQPVTLAQYEPIPAVQAQFANYPPLHTRLAEELGIRAEQSTDELVGTVLADLSNIPH